jgi:hypothetical protein
VTSVAIHPKGTAVSALGAARLMAGAAIYAAPSLVGRAFTGTPSNSPSSRLFARAMGIREISLGAGILAAGSNARPRTTPWLLAAAASDLGDAMASLLMRSVDQNRRRWSFAASVAPAVLELGLVGAQLRRIRARRLLVIRPVGDS